jgi:hypothetical protein
LFIIRASSKRAKKLKKVTPQDGSQPKGEVNRIKQELNQIKGELDLVRRQLDQIKAELDRIKRKRNKASQ